MLLGVRKHLTDETRRLSDILVDDLRTSPVLSVTEEGQVEKVHNTHC